MRVSVLIAALFSAPPALAQNFFRIDVQVKDPGGNWVNFIAALPGDAISCRFLVSWRENDAASYGGFTLRQLDVHGSRPGDAVAGWSTINVPPYADVQLVGAGSVDAEIKRTASDPTLAFNQPTIDMGGSAANPILTGEFQYLLDATNLDDRFLQLTLDGGARGRVLDAFVYTTRAAGPQIWSRSPAS